MEEEDTEVGESKMLFSFLPPSGDDSMALDAPADSAATEAPRTMTTMATKAIIGTLYKRRSRGELFMMMMLMMVLMMMTSI